MTDTGPPYPRSVSSGAAIGEFVIGSSAIGGGSSTTFDFWSTVISQYANSPILTQLISNFFEYIDPTANLGAFFDSIWNIDTAQGYGLDVWGRIVGVTRTVAIPAGDFFGFEEALPTSVPFNTAPFYAGPVSTNNYQLSDTDFRTLIFAKALSNISDGSIPSINQILLNLFPGRGNCYVTDGEDMTMTYTFEFVLSAVELAVLQQSGALPKPVGVSATIVQI